MDGYYEEIGRALELEPLNLSAFIDRGYSAFYAGDLETALADGETATALNPRSSSALFLVFEVNWALDNIEAASAAITTFLNLRHNNDEMALTLQSPATVSMLNGRTFTFPLYLQAGQNVSLSADSPETSGRVDTFLLVFDPVGQLVDYNDDRDYDNGDYNSLLTFTADVTGIYHAIVTHSGGNREGDVTVTLQDNAIR